MTNKIKNENNFQGQTPRSNVTNFELLLAFTRGRIPTKSQPLLAFTRGRIPTKLKPLLAFTRGRIPTKSQPLLAFTRGRIPTKLRQFLISIFWDFFCGQTERRTDDAKNKVQLLTCKTPDFITPTLRPANSPDVSPADYRISGKLQERVYRSQIHDVAQLK